MIMKKLNKIKFIFLISIILTLGVYFLPKSFAIQEPDDLIGTIVTTEELLSITPNYYGDYEFFGIKDFGIYLYEKEDLIAEVPSWGDDYPSSWSNHPAENYLRVPNSICGIRKGWGHGTDCNEDILNNYTGYWKIVKYLGMDQYSTIEYALVPAAYEAPTFKLSCNPKSIKKGEQSECELSTKYYSKFKNLNFKIDVLDYEVVDVKPGNNFENLQLVLGVYTVAGKDNMEESGDGIETTIIKFKVTSNDDKEVKNTNNIKVIDLNYSNSFENNSFGVLADTISKDESKAETDTNTVNDTIKNPKTGDKVFLIIALMSISLVIGTIIYKKRVKEY